MRPPQVEEAANGEDASAGERRKAGTPVISAFPVMDGWFSDEERTTSPRCRTAHAIANDEASVLVCLACAAVSIDEGTRAEGRRENRWEEA